MAEKEYIERNALAEEIASLSVIVTGIRCGKSYLNEIVNHYKKSIDRIINEQPTADVVEVVRCKDCTRYDKSRREGYIGGLCMFTHSGVLEMDFCSRGERKENNHG